MYYGDMNQEHEPKIWHPEKPEGEFSSEIPETAEHDQEIFLEQAIGRVHPEDRPQFLGYLRKYEVPTDVATLALKEYEQGGLHSMQSYLEQWKQDGEAPRPGRKAA